MATNEPVDIAAIFREGTLIDRAMNLAVRPIVAQKYGLKAVEFAAGHQEFNPMVRNACKVPVYRFVEIGDGLRALRKEELAPEAG